MRYLRRLSLTNASLLQITSRPLVSEHGPPVTGTLLADEIAAQSPSTPAVSGLHPSITAPPPATPASGPSVPPGPKMEFYFNRQVKNDKELGKVAEDSMENLGLSTIEIVSGTINEPPPPYTASLPSGLQLRLR